MSKDTEVASSPPSFACPSRPPESKSIRPTGVATMCRDRRIVLLIAGRPSIDDATLVGFYDYGTNARVHAGAAERCGFGLHN